MFFYRVFAMLDKTFGFTFFTHTYHLYLELERNVYDVLNYCVSNDYEKHVKEMVVQSKFLKLAKKEC